VYIDKSPIPGMKPINEAVKDDLGTFAQQIVDAILPPRKGRYHQIFEPWLALKARGASELRSEDDLDGAIIDDANEEALEVFEFIDRSETWAGLLSVLPDGMRDNRWREELFHVIRRIAEGLRFSPIQAVFQTNPWKMYRAIAHGVGRFADQH